jgi:hypothetical protein
MHVRVEKELALYTCGEKEKGILVCNGKINSSECVGTQIINVMNLRTD